MNITAFLALCLIPVVAVFLIFIIAVPEMKLRYALSACVLGAITIFPATMLQYFLMNLPIFLSETVISLLVTAIIFNGLVEETFKMLFISFIPQKKITLAVFFSCAILAGITLGSLESIIYLIKKTGQALIPFTKNDLLKLIFSRMFTSVLIHTLCACLGGLYVWNFRHKKNSIMPFIWAVLLHGFYNFFAGFTSFFYIFSIIAILYAALECRIWYKKSATSGLPTN